MLTCLIHLLSLRAGSKEASYMGTGLNKAAPCKNYNRTVPKALSHAQECKLKLERHSECCDACCDG